MSDEKKGLVPFGTVKLEVVKERRVRDILFPDNPAPTPETEVVSDEDKRFEQALARRADSPTDFIREIGRFRPPLSKGARVAAATLLGFMEAMEEVVPLDSGYPVQSSVKISMEPGDDSKVFIEGGTSSVWAAGAIKAESKLKHRFEVLAPLIRTRNVLRALGDQVDVVVGVDKRGVCIGAHSVPFGGRLEEFSVQPVLVDPIVQAALPGSYCHELIDKVLIASSSHMEEFDTNGVLIDFDICTVDGKEELIATAIATDTNRMHILQLPQMMIRSLSTRLPPAVRVSTSFFRYLARMVNSEWICLEFSDTQLVAKAEDFIVVAKVAIEKKSAHSAMGVWRQLNITYGGHWMVDRSALVGMLVAASGEIVRLRFNAQMDEMIVSSTTKDNLFYEKKDYKHARRFAGAPYVDVSLDRELLMDAVKSCSDLVRFEFEPSTKMQNTAPVMVGAEDGQFKAIIMPLAIEEEDESSLQF